MAVGFRNFTHSILLLGLFAVAGCSPAVFNGLASNDRNWQEQVSRLAVAHWVNGREFVLRDLRAWEFGTDGPRVRTWVDRRVDTQTVKGIWFFFAPFKSDDDHGHTFITFEMERQGRPDFLTLSIEARREVGEDYSTVRGLIGAYDLAYVWSTEKDIFTNTALALDRRVHMYKVNVSAAQAAIILKAFVERSNQLTKEPELYHSLLSNCATELAAVINEQFGAKIPWQRSFRRTGEAAGYLHRLGYIENPETPFAEIRRVADITRLIVTYQRQPDPQLSTTIRRNYRRLAPFR